MENTVDSQEILETEKVQEVAEVTREREDKDRAEQLEEKLPQIGDQVKEGEGKLTCLILDETTDFLDMTEVPR